MYRDLSTEYKCGQLDQTLILPLLTKVRLVCTHPLLVNSDQKYLINGSDSGKFDFLLRLLSNVHDRSEKIVIVSNFTSVLDSIEMLLLSAKAMGKKLSLEMFALPCSLSLSFFVLQVMIGHLSV